ncbi:MAG TPA: hypothetical protein VGJ26_01885, partial [Pirellulales bacterium]
KAAQSSPQLAVKGPQDETQRRNATYRIYRASGAVGLPDLPRAVHGQSATARSAPSDHFARPA